MDTKTLAVELSNALAWPLTVVILAAIFRQPVVKLLPRIRKVESPFAASRSEGSVMTNTAEPEKKRVLTLRNLILVVLVIGISGGIFIWGVFPENTGDPKLVKDKGKLYEITYQFFLLAVLGGGVSLLYSVYRQEREQAAKTLEQELLFIATANEKKNDRNRLLATELFKAYGEFFAVWKAWNYYKSDEYKKRTDPLSIEISSLYDRALTAEGIMESLLVNVSSSIQLNENELNDLGRLRQGFQQLRESIRDNKLIPWKSANDPRYAEFKRLITALGELLFSAVERDQPTPAQAHESLLSITANEHEAYWISK